MQHRWKERISSRPEVPAGKPVISGTRISVEFRLDRLDTGRNLSWDVEEYLPMEFRA